MDFFNALYGSFLGSHLPWSILGSIAILLLLGFVGAPFLLWSVAITGLLIGFQAPMLLLYVFLGIALIFNIPILRRLLVTSSVMKLMKSFLPKISDTERVALEAGVVWVEKDLFSGKPNFKKMLEEPYPHLTQEEQDFINGPVERLCEVANDWKVTKNKELPPEAWEIIKKERFFGMIIPKEYGGLAFSALAHSEVIMKLASRSVTACISVMVPNSLGPAELLIHYGTDAQKKNLLPKLATGEEIPCFALTEPTAGSDAGSLTASGELFKGEDGKLYLKLNWNKRWITLAAISTTLGLAFRLKDPQNLLGKGEDVGITCALIPSKTPGVILGNRHDPLGIPFWNCPTQGHDVIVSAEDCIVGGTKMAGHGWQMLMDCLSAGRGISLPAQSTGISKLVTRAASAHASIRKQFGVPIGSFEGVEEPLARIASLNYLLEASRRFTCGALDQGIKPPVVTAMAKYNSTEIQRKIVNDGMDILGGQGISKGPRNLIANAYIATPVGITVEGANIMTRTLIIFGQGALRAHPFAFQEVAAVEKNDLSAFDKAFWGHIGHVVRNASRSVLLSLTRGYLAPAPVGNGVANYYRKLSWASATFAIMADIAMGSLGGTLKFREKITGRFADILSWMYLGFATLRRFEAEGSKKDDLPFVDFCLKHSLVQIQQAFNGIFENINVPGLSWFFKGPIRWWSKFNSLSDEANDSTTHRIAKLIQQDSEQRNRMTDGIYYPKLEGESLLRIEKAFKVIKAAEQTESKIRKAIKEKKIPKVKGFKAVEESLKAGLITEAEAINLKKAEELRLDAITVDDFNPEQYFGSVELIAKRA
ncbi:MAG: acyl-CoA dehydrogenase [Deltaproteobacteria bacterium]|nr:acyl-CoA dehydrogenase [Deltaproteobacteria bacterium]